MTNTDCKAWELDATSNSPGVCKFRSYELDRITTDPKTSAEVADKVIATADPQGAVLTWGVPLMRESAALEAGASTFTAAGPEINIRTNELNLLWRMGEMASLVGVHTLAVDGTTLETVNWSRGATYLDLFPASIEELRIRDTKIGISTFPSPKNLDDLLLLANCLTILLDDVAINCRLPSQYRPIRRPNPTERDIDGYSEVTLNHLAWQFTKRGPANVAVLVQPTRNANDPPPLCVWDGLNGDMTADLRSAAVPRIAKLGSLFARFFSGLVKAAHSERRFILGVADLPHKL